MVGREKGFSDKVIHHVLEGGGEQPLFHEVGWTILNLASSALIIICGLLLPLASSDSSSPRSRAAVYVAFAFGAIGLLPLSLLVSSTLRSKISLWSHQLSLITSLVALLNLSLHIAWGLPTTDVVVGGLSFTGSLAACFMVVLLVRSGHDHEIISRLTPHCRGSTRLIQNLQNLQFEEVFHPPPSNLDGISPEHLNF